MIYVSMVDLISNHGKISSHQVPYFDDHEDGASGALFHVIINVLKQISSYDDVEKV